MNLDDMRLFAALAENPNMTAAAKRLGMPKQTLSRRIARLEQSLEVQLLTRTTRRIRLTDVGAAYAERCARIVALARDANRDVTDAQQTPTGTLRVTADRVFGQAYLHDLVIDYARRCPEVRVEVLLTSRRVNLVEEGFDVAFRIGDASAPNLTATSLGPARVKYCASPEYLEEHGTPEKPEDLSAHSCLSVLSDDSTLRWPFRDETGRLSLVQVSGRLHLGDHSMVRAAALAGLGIAIFPEFSCAADIVGKRLVPVLEDWDVDVGSVWIVNPTSRYLAPRVRLFVAMALERIPHAPRRDA